MLRPVFYYRTHAFPFPIKPSEIPVNRPKPSKGYNPSTNPTKRTQIAPFQLSAPFGHLRSDRHPQPYSTQNTPFFNIFLTAFWQTLVFSETNFPILQD